MAAVAGFATGGSLIVAIGSQNAFVLRQGLRQEHVLPIVAICASADALLILSGVAGLGEVIQAAPAALAWLRFAGAAFLAAYGVMALRRTIMAPPEMARCEESCWLCQAFNDKLR